MTQKRMSERLGKKVSKDDLVAGKDYVEDMFDALGTEDPNWNHKKVKALVKALIESKIIFQAQSSDQVFLERILLSKELNKTGGKWGKFFKDLPSAALTKEGLKEIINFVDSNKKSPPEIGTGDQDETEDYTETELSDAKTSSIATKDIDTTNLLGPVKLDSVDTILAHSKIQSQILSADKDSMEFFIKYCIHKLWNLAFKFRDKTYEEVKTGVKASKTKNEFLRQYVGRFLKEYEGTMALQLPKQYKFPEKPNLMQLYVGNSKKDASILKQLESALKKKKISCGFYTGNTSTQKRRSVLEAFLRKKITVLIASVPISVGVDGLQGVCSRLIFNSLPWTHAQYEQIVGRVARQGQTKPVTIFHINGKLTFSKNGKKRSLEYDKAIKHSRIKYKQTLSDCAVDGIIPKSKDLATPKQAAKEAVRWLKRLQSGKEPEITK